MTIKNMAASVRSQLPGSWHSSRALRPRSAGQLSSAKGASPVPHKSLHRSQGRAAAGITVVRTQAPGVGETLHGEGEGIVLGAVAHQGAAYHLELAAVG